MLASATVQEAAYQAQPILFLSQMLELHKGQVLALAWSTQETFHNIVRPGSQSQRYWVAIVPTKNNISSTGSGLHIGAPGVYGAFSGSHERGFALDHRDAITYNSRAVQIEGKIRAKSMLPGLSPGTIVGDAIAKESLYIGDSLFVPQDCLDSLLTRDGLAHSQSNRYMIHAFGARNVAALLADTVEYRSLRSAQLGNPDDLAHCTKEIKGLAAAGRPTLERMLALAGYNAKASGSAYDLHI